MLISSINKNWSGYARIKTSHIFIDYVHAQYLWKPDAAYLATLTQQLEHSGFEKIKATIGKIYHSFIQSLLVVSTTDF